MSAAVAEQPKAKKTDERSAQLELVWAALPKHPELVRKTAFLWDGHYRVNYHDPKTSLISESYFVTLVGEKVEFEKEIKPRKVE